MKDIKPKKNSRNIRKENTANDKTNDNSLYEDEIVIINKETTYTRACGGENEKNKNGKIATNLSIKKNNELNESDIMKYHDIIQDLTNMILIYENYFFKKNVKPKNNNELLCLMIVEYINKKIKKIKLNTLINLIIYSKLLPKKNKNRRYIDSDNRSDEEINTGMVENHRNIKKKKIKYDSEDE